MLAACLPLLVASVIAAASHLHRSTSEKVCHLGCYLVQTQLPRSDTFFFWTQTHILYMCIDCIQHGTLPIFLVPVMTKTFVKTIHYVDIPMHPAIICFEQALGDIKTCSLVFWLLWFQKARTIPLSNYYLWHRSTHYIDSQVNNKSFHNNGANIKFVFPLSF